MIDIKHRDHENVTELTMACGDCGGPLIAYGVMEAGAGYYSITAECEHCNKRVFIDLNFFGVRFYNHDALDKWLNT